ncbi:amidohydrolase [Leifsonia poae]|uniref:amidohydrolase n=1 Tax=Leifsonia poae TaxID=110933 RepID=UPI001CBF625E|nr:amidohydrolase family protein [Leifsonia poae]
MTLLLRGGRLPGIDGAVDLLVECGRIARIARAGRLRAEETVAVDGRWVVPGLWDNHVHFSQWASTSRRLDLSGARSAAEAADRVRRRVEESPGDDPIVGFGFHDALWPDSPSRGLLDRAGGDRVVVLIAGDLHSCWVNTAAARRFAPLTADDPEASVLREEASFAVTTELGAADPTTLDRWAGDAARAAAARGVVGIVDLEFGSNLESWQRRISAGLDAVRVEYGVYREQLDGTIRLGLSTGDPIEGTGGLLTVGPYKVITDGSLNTRTALCFEPYPSGAPAGHPSGISNLTQEELIASMRLAAEHGIEPAVHAIGDRANRLALDAFEAVSCRGRIEHAQLVAPEDVPRFARLGVTASVQPEHAMDDRDVADALWPGRTQQAFPLASLHRAGAALALGSDAPVAPLDPWIAVAAAVGRSRDGREPWHPEQSISRVVAFEASARSRIAVGEPADLVVVERDPVACSLAELRTMSVAATLVGGRFTHDLLR